MQEVWDSYRRDGTRLGKIIIKGSEIPTGQYHLAAEVFVLHKDGTVLCLRRSYDKETYAGYYETTIRGYALQGEDSMDCVERELKEKLGIQAYNFKMINTVVSEEKHCIYHCYICYTNCVHNQIIAQRNEAFAYQWFTRDEFRELVKECYVLPSQYLHYFNLFMANGYIKSIATSDIIGLPIEVDVDDLYQESGRDNFDMAYGSNVGHIDGLKDEYGKIVQAYILGVDRPLTTFRGVVAGIITYPFTNNSSKLIVVPDSTLYTIDQMERFVAHNEPGVQFLIKIK